MNVRRVLALCMIVALSGALAAQCPPPPPTGPYNTVPVKDADTCGFWNTPATPAGLGDPNAPQGQPNTPTVALNQNLYGQGTGPIEYWGFGGAGVTSTQVGPTANQALLIGPPATGWANIPGLGKLDIDLTSPALGCVYDNNLFGGALGGVCLAPGVGGPTINLGYPLPMGQTAMLLSAQGAVADPSSAFGLSVTARVDIGVQDTSALGPPEMPPFVNATTVPIVAAPPNTPGHFCNAAALGVASTPIVGTTTSVFPYPRDVICPNNGPLGTIHSALGWNFDATTPGATTATVNLIPVNIILTRPYEIRFHLTPAHIPNIGGPLEITTAAGNSYGTLTTQHSEDQMGHWVFMTPPVTQMLVETDGVQNPGTNPGTYSPATGVGYGGGGNNMPSGTFSNAPMAGLQGAVGYKDGNNQDDYWDLEGVAPGTEIVAFLGELGDVSGQIRTQCSGLQPPPGTNVNVCYISTTQAWSQQWYANQPNAWNDTWLQLGIGTGTGSPIVGAFVFSQDDGGPGTDSFARWSSTNTYNHPAWPGTPSGTIPASDPDTAFPASGTDWFVCSDFGNYYPNPAVVVPYTYIILSYW